MVEIDRKDRKILYELDRDSRQAFSALAKKVGLSKDSVFYRVEKMKEKGIIKGFHTLINVGKLGFYSFRLYLKFENIDPKKKEEIIEFLKKEKIVMWIVSIDGKYDLGLWILSKSIAEVSELYKKIINKFPTHILDKSLTLFSKVSYYTREYILEGKNSKKEVDFVMNQDPQKLDNLDLRILKSLSLDPRISLVNLSHKLNSNPKTIISRIKKLEENKIILGYKTFIDLDMLGYKYYKLHLNLNNASEKKIHELKDFITSHPNIVYDNEILGGDNIEVEIQTENINTLREIINSILEKYKGMIKNYFYMSFFKEHKFVFLPEF